MIDRDLIDLYKKDKAAYHRAVWEVLTYIWEEMRKLKGELPSGELIRQNAAKGYLYVGTVGENIIWKKDNGQGGYTYSCDYGYPDYVPTLWDTTISSTEELELILIDIKLELKGKKNPP